MADGEFLELVRENGRIVMRGRSTSPSCISYTSHSAKAQANGGKIIHNRKRPRFLETKLSRDPTNPKGEKSVEKIPIPELVRERNDQIQQSGPFLFSRSVEDGSQSLSSNSNSKQTNSGFYHRNLGLRNFSLFLKSAELHKANNSGHNQAVTGASSSGFQELKSKKEDPSVVKTASCSNTSKDFHENQNLDQIRQVVYQSKESILPVEQSEAPPVHGNAIKSVAAGKSIDQLAADTSMCSLGASNDHTCYSLKRKNNEESEERASRIIENVEEEQDPKLTSARTGNKKRRTSEIHNLSERKRRDKINKKMRALQALIPNSNKVDKVSTLDNAIEYLKSLQLQLQIMSTMRSGICMPPVMLASGMQQIQAANLGHLSALGMGIGMRMPMHPTPLLNSPMIRMLPIAVPSHPPFIPVIGGSSTPSAPPPPLNCSGGFACPN